MSKNVIEGLIPEILWEKFYEISQIPRQSKHEDKIRTYLKNFAGVNNLIYKEDRAGNIVIYLPPVPGFENSPTIVLQSHVDMVCEKNKDKVHDFEKDPIELIRDGDWIKANGTTLGADNGIGVAAALSIALDNSFEHGPIELLFTVDEETGLTGADSLERDFITGKYLLNLDTEEDGAFYIGCAGGMDTVGTFKIEYGKFNKEYTPYYLFISGLKGGHSGINIHEGRANAIKLLGQILKNLEGLNYQISYIAGGSKRNAIPREAEAILWLHPDDELKAIESVNAFVIESTFEYKNKESDIKIIFERKETNGLSKKVFSSDFVNKIINVILAIPHGVISMSAEIDGLVETSSNLATLIIEDDYLRIGTSQRSSVESAKRNIGNSVRAVFELAGAEISVLDKYPAWQPNTNSRLLELSKNVYKKLFGAEPEFKAVHAGLECGILINKFPWLDMISLGPTIEGAHSPDERVKISDVEKFYKLLKAIISELSKERT
ncbi:aminoacyl-histidine dipeptidase [Rosettibacter firmus]|uniref:aminoacyl-histidine dipeptidase n=1 Tax=Rosettibacter firmus TaxID=3111522 RepID=UPI00336BF2B8